MIFDIDELEVVSTGTCFGCQNHDVDLYCSPNGLRCESCFDPFEDESVTYVPDLRYTPGDTEDRGQEIAENLEEFQDDLDDIALVIEFADESELELDKFESNAVMIKYGDEWESFIDALRSKVEEYYRHRRKPVKRGGEIPWSDDDEFETQAELAEEVASQHLRSALMQLAFTGMAGDDENPVEVIGLGSESVTYYSETGRITIPYDDGGDNT